MKEYGKRVQIDPAEFWAMVDAGKTRTEIAKHYGVSVQTVCNRITKGRPSAKPAAKNDSERERKFEEIIDSVDAGKKKENNDMDTYNNEPCSCDTESFEKIDATGVYWAMFAEAAASIVKSAEYASINIQYANVTVEDGCTVASVKGVDALGRACTLHLTVGE